MSFVGVVDKTVVFKKCGPTAGGGGVGSVDAVLYGMSGSGGYFRVVGSGNVAGVGQCTGDLRLDQCEDCLSEAIKRLKSECGSGDYGDVFLGKCYARFSVGGAHAFYEQPKANNGKTHTILFLLLFTEHYRKNVRCKICSPTKVK